MSNARRRAYRSRHKTTVGRGGAVVLIVALLAVALFISAVILGNYLRSLVPEESGTGDGSGGTEAPGGFDIASVPIVIARGILLGQSPAEIEPTETSDTAAPAETTGAPVTDPPPETTDTAGSETSGETQPPAAAEIAYNAYSVVLRDATGKLGYASDITDRYNITEHADIRLGAAVDLLGKKHISGIFYVFYPSEPSLSRPFIREYELSLLRELFAAGVDDIVLCGFGDSDAELEEAVAFVRELSQSTGGRGKAGIALDFDFWSRADAQERIRALHFDCGFFAFDLYSVEVPGLMSADALISDRLERCGDVVNMYSARVLLGCGEAPDADTQVRAAMTGGALNVQFVIK